jgi:hypothetical protein
MAIYYDVDRIKAEIADEISGAKTFGEIMEAVAVYIQANWDRKSVTAEVIEN